MFLHEPGEEADSYTRQDLSTIQHAARQIDGKSSMPRSNSSRSGTKTVEEGHTEPVEYSALPPTASWATKASPPLQNSKLSRPNQSTTTSPIKPASIAQHPSNGTSTAEVRASASSVHADSQSAIALSATNHDQRSIMPPIVPAGDQRLEPNATLQLFESALKLLSLSSSVKFSFSSQLLAKEDMAGAQSMPPLFAFSEKLQSDHTADAADTKILESGARQISRYSFLDKPKMSEHLLEQQQMMQGGTIMGLRSGATPPPPGLFGNGQREGQEILSMVGGQSKGIY